MKLFFLNILILPILFSAQPAVTSRAVEKNHPEQIEAKQLDPQAQVLAAYLAKYNSPLQYHAQDFVDAANKYDLDWKLVPAIAGVESTFGKFTPGGYNGWGWGVYGTQSLYFKSWREGIYTVSQGLKENYVNRGLTNPYLMNRTYAASPRWGGKVNYFIEDIERFAINLKQSITDVRDSQLKIAVKSGQLAL